MAWLALIDPIPVPAWSGTATVHRIEDDNFPEQAQQRLPLKPWALLTGSSEPTTSQQAAACWPLLTTTTKEGQRP